MKDKRRYQFYKLYKGLMMAFDLPEAVFMVYMADLNQVRELGFNTIRPLKSHLGCLGFGRRVFECCVKKTITMGLLKRIPFNGMYDYYWDMEAYDRLIQIVSATSKYQSIRKFCNMAFSEDNRTVMSITYDEIKALEAEEW